MMVYNIDLLFGNLYCAGALRIGFKDALASLLTFIYCLNSRGNEFQQCYSVVHFLACAGYIAPCTRYLQTSPAKPETGEQNWSNSDFIQRHLFCIVFHYQGTYLSGSVTTDFLPEPITFNRMQHPLPPSSQITEEHFSGLLNTSWRLIYSPDGLSTLIHFSSTPPLYLLIDKVLLFYYLT